MPVTLEKYLEQGLTQEHFEIALELEKLHQAKLVQFGDAGTAYKTALNLSDEFQARITQIAEILHVERLSVVLGLVLKMQNEFC